MGWPVLAGSHRRRTQGKKAVVEAAIVVKSDPGVPPLEVYFDRLRLLLLVFLLRARAVTISLPLWNKGYCVVGEPAS